jgi:DinB superfamily
MDALDIFLKQHLRLHSSMVEDGNDFPLEDGLLGPLSEDQIRAAAAPGANSIAWLLWHMARSEDIGVNLFVAGRPQVIEDSDWARRLNISDRGMAPA